MSLRDKYDDEEWKELEKRSAQFFEDKKKEESTKYVRVEIATDDDGHDYVFPYELKNRFYELLDSGIEGEDDFINEFEKWQCGGDPSSQYEFYIKA